MILRLSQKLAAKVRTTAAKPRPLDPNPFADWSGHLFRADRTQYILVTNTASLYSSILFGRGITADYQLIDRALSEIREVLTGDGLQFFYLRFIVPAADRVTLARSLNRSVTGSMNDLVAHAQMWLTEGGLSPYDTSFKLNEIPMSAIGYQSPRQAMRSLRPGRGGGPEP
jgi:Domain of unknown function (DUF6933)